jgi:hypothetical protein
MLSLLLSTASCGSSFQANGVLPKTEPSPQASEPSPQASVNFDTICERVAEIKVLPMKVDRPSDDPAYNALMAAGEKAIPCLIKTITDTTEMTDPRQAPKVTGVRVGDVAFFMLVRVSNIDFVEVLPPEVQKHYAQDGVYGYFEMIDENNNRQKLQKAAHKWYEQNYDSNVRKKGTIK